MKWLDRSLDHNKNNKYIFNQNYNIPEQFINDTG